jgi:2-C-methyl-D-erythritol 2,4-cyclodiphosphate synthase
VLFRSFPDNDPEFKDIYSIKLLERTHRILLVQGFNIVNIDTTIFAEKPRLSPYKDAMRDMIARTLNLYPGFVNIKATTTEGLGMIGEGEGIGAMCVALIE